MAIHMTFKFLVFQIQSIQIVHYLIYLKISMQTVFCSNSSSVPKIKFLKIYHTSFYKVMILNTLL